MLVPHLGSLVVETVTGRGAGVVVDARLREAEAACPRCGQPSQRVHSRYRRRLVDAPIAGRPVQLRLRVRRLFCDNTACAARTFAEQPAALTAPRARRTSLLARMLASIAVALAGRAGARLADRLGMPTSRDSLLRLLRGLPDAPATVSGRQVPTFRARAQARLAPPTCRTPSGQSAGSPQTCPGAQVMPRFRRH